MDTFSINSVNLLQALSMALDLAVNGVNAHQWRTAVICSHLADKLGIRASAQNGLVVSALVHDIGAAPNMDERQKLADPNQEAQLGRDIFLHAQAGYELLNNSAWVFGQAADTVLYHHDFWQGGNPSGLSGDRIPLNSRIIHVADRVDVLMDRRKPLVQQMDTVRKFITTGSGTKFDPGVVDAFLACAELDSFWLDMVNSNYQATFLSRFNWGQTQITAREFLDVANLFATIIDRMSVFTATHSRSVAKVAVLLSRLNGFCENEQYLMNIAGLLHDLGKLSVPNSLLEKPAKLSPEEMVIIRQHSYWTYRILERIENFGDIAKWAAFHHETQDNKGYPFRIPGSSLPLGSRIMAVADIFVALAENRPYRARMERDGVIRIMRDMAAHNKIDGRIVEMLVDNYQAADDIVLGSCEKAA